MIADNLIKILKRNEELIIILGVSLCWNYLWLEVTLLQEQSAKWSLKLLLMRVHRDIGMILKTRSALISNATILVFLLLIYKEKQNLNVYSVKYRKSSFSSLDPWHWWKMLIPRNPTPRKPLSIRFSSCLHCFFFWFSLNNKHRKYLFSQCGKLHLEPPSLQNILERGWLAIWFNNTIANAHDQNHLSHLVPAWVLQL